MNAVINLLLLILILAAALYLIPLTVYLCVKVGTLAFLRARDLYHKERENKQ